MLSLQIPLVLLLVHTIADFFLQTDWMAVNKSKNWLALFTHVLVYSLCFSIWGLQFFLITFATHFVTDAVTSRVTSKLWAANQRHWFFVTIGVDQLCHFTTLTLTYSYLKGLL